MCFSKGVSLVVLFFGLLASLKLYLTALETEDVKRKNIYYSVAIFTFVVSIMQLNEFFIWSYQDTKSFYHQIFSICIYFTLYLQAVGLYYAVMYYDLTEEEWQKTLLTVFFVLQTIGFLYGLYYIGYKRFGQLKTVPSDCTSRLAWDAAKSYNKHHHKMYLLYMMSYFALNLMATYFILKWPGLVVSILVIILAMMYSIYSKCSYLQYGSMWCFVIVLLCATVFLFDEKMVDYIQDS